MNKAIKRLEESSDDIIKWIKEFTPTIDPEKIYLGIRNILSFMYKPTEKINKSKLRDKIMDYLDPFIERPVGLLTDRILKVLAPAVYENKIISTKCKRILKSLNEESESVLGVLTDYLKINDLSDYKVMNDNVTDPKFGLVDRYALVTKSSKSIDDALKSNEFHSAVYVSVSATDEPTKYFVAVNNSDKYFSDRQPVYDMDDITEKIDQLKR